ncbi:hypothetical protein [Azohydromonas lata]|uniref:hypothetical protein n=1 Tax=Azohydromonas lata TaxID=45677 RepID=UPI00082EDC58|nr:hypothetical protein [Azohydromonas lata]
MGAASASSGQAVRELPRLVLTELHGFELLALPAGALCRLSAQPRRRAGLGGPWTLPAASVRACGLPQACTVPAPWPATSASAGQAVRELPRLVLTELQGFELLALPAGSCTDCRRHDGAALASVDLWAFLLASHQRQRRPSGA